VLEAIVSKFGCFQLPWILGIRIPFSSALEFRKFAVRSLECPSRRRPHGSSRGNAPTKPSPALWIRILCAEQNLTEPSILRATAAAALDADIPIFLGNSMPIRDFDSCVHALSNRVVNVFANRGASGIDGNIATIAGLAMG
jgi:hypothetical protein